MPEELAASSRSPISRRTVIGAAAWSVPVVALTVATPAHAASGAGALNATGVVLSFTDPQWSSEFRLSGQLALAPAAAAAVDVTATITWQGTGGNSAAQGLYMYQGIVPGAETGIPGWTVVQGAADDQLYTTFVLRSTVAAGSASVPTVSLYDGVTTKPIMYGAETWVGADSFWDGIITIRFSAPGYADAVVEAPYTMVV